MVYANYAFVDATIQTDVQLPSPNNPMAVPATAHPDAGNCINATKGDRLPGIPRNRFKAGFDYWLTPQWKFGADLVVASDQIFFGDWSNLNAPLAGYATVNIHTLLRRHQDHFSSTGCQQPVRHPLRGLRHFFDLDANTRRPAARYGPASSPTRARSRRRSPSRPTAACRVKF